MSASVDWVDLHGTLRKRGPERTIARLRPWLPHFGITRVADVSALDSLGLPVMVAIRPAARHISVAQGKGITRDLAWISAVMEAIESWHAEHPPPPAYACSVAEMHARGREVLLPCRLAPGPFEVEDIASRPFAWHEAQELRTGRPVWLSNGTLSFDTHTPRPELAIHAPTSNGLASGNDREEAICHALYELVERACVRRWRSWPEAARHARRLDLDSVADPGLQRLITRYRDAGGHLEIYDVEAGELGVPVFVATLFPSADDSFWCFREYGGAGAHFDPKIALYRALTEAAQSRLSMISGAREDNFPEDYYSTIKPSEPPAAVLPFRDAAIEPARQLAELLQAIARVGCPDIVIFEHPGLEQRDFAVVQAFVPGLEEALA